MSCITCQGQLGAIPIAASIVGWMVESRLSAGQAAARAAQEYEEFKRFNEAQVTDLALELADESGIPYWEWFNTLRSAQSWSLSQPENDRQPPPITDRNGEPKPQQWGWIAVAGLAAVALFFILGGD